MEEALPLFGLAAMIAATALTIRVLADWWIRAKHVERGDREALAEAPLARIEARLTRIEEALEATAVEVERIGEAERFATKLLAEQRTTVPRVPDGHRSAAQSD